MQQSTQSTDIFSTVPVQDYLNLPSELKSVPDFLNFRKLDISKATRQPKNSIRYDERISSELKKSILEIGNIINLVANYFEGDLEKTKLWFSTPNPLLGDASPKDMILYGRINKLHKFVLNALSNQRP